MGLPFPRTVCVLIVAVCALVSCSPPVPQLAGFDATAWSADKNGCSGNRLTQQSVIEQNRTVLLAQPEAGILEVLGKPDRVELYKRNQKLYHYFLSGGPVCPDSAAQVELLVRFNAMGRAKEIIIQ